MRWLLRSLPDHGVSLGVASHQLLIAMALRERLTRVDEMFHTGRIGLRLVSAIVSRTALIIDPHARAKVDIELAAAIAGWGVLSQAKSSRPSTTRWTAMTRTRCGGRSARVPVAMWTGPQTVGGRATIEAVLFDHDAAAVDARLEAMARRCVTRIRARWISGVLMRLARSGTALNGSHASADPTTATRPVCSRTRWWST